jgi:hypothetical protein
MGRLAMPKKDSNWDKDSFQGKRKEQVENALLSMTIAVVGIVILIALIVIDSLWK